MASGAVPATAEVVGNAFVSQYYNVLHQSPGVVHRFYTDDSKFTRETPDGGVETLTSQQDIHNKVISLNYNEINFEIKSVDSQTSFNSGVLVMVTGTMSSKSTGKRTFVQTFFLAPQEKGFYVLNDVFRYVDGAPLNKTPYSMPNGVADSMVPSVPETEEQLGAEELVGEDEIPTEEDQYVMAGDEGVEEEVLEEEPLVSQVQPVEDEPAVQQHPVHEQVPTPAPPVQEYQEPPATKKSYASIVSLMRNNPQPMMPRTKPAPVARPSPADPVLPAPAPVLPSEESPADTEGDKRSVYVKNLPMNVTEQQLEAEFKKFGAIKPGGITIRTIKQQNYCYAFIDFEDQQSAQNALQGSGFQIGDRTVYVEEKKAPASGRRFADKPGGNGSGRGRGGYGGRGSGDQESSGRGYDGRRERGENRGERGENRGERGGFNRSRNAPAQSEGVNDEGFRRYEGQRSQRRSSGYRNGGARNAAAE